MKRISGSKLRSCLHLSFFLCVCAVLAVTNALALDAVNLPAQPSPSSPQII